MAVHLSQFSLPIAPHTPVGAKHSKAVQLLFQAFIRVQEKVLLLAGWAEHAAVSNSLDARLAEALPAAGDLMGLPKDEQTDGARGTHTLRQLLHELTLVSRLCHDRHCSLAILNQLAGYIAVFFNKL